MIEQVYVDRKSEFVLVPKIGRERIEFGTLKGYKDKLENLEIFYKEGLRTMGWNKYKSISLKIDDQVVCEKIDTKENQ
jgi:cell division protein FtsQ